MLVVPPKDCVGEAELVRCAVCVAAVSVSGPDGERCGVAVRETL